jgi:glycosyltransferase involved in cell wall biosynthesis
MKKPFFSIIVPTLNEEKFLPNLLKSLVDQYTTDFEVIIVDGNSTDKTVSVAKSFQKKLPNLHVLQYEKAGIPWQRNEGAEHATAHWLLFIDADTVLLPYCLSRLQSLLKRQKNVHHFTPWYALDGNTAQDALLTLLINGTMEASIITKRQAALGPFSGFSRTLFDLLEGYDEQLEWGEDADISRRAFEAGYILTIFRETLAIYSLRRFKKQGTLRTMRTYTLNAFQVFLTKRTASSIPGYIMGGHLYSPDERKESISLLKQFQQRLNKLTTELFGT